MNIEVVDLRKGDRFVVVEPVTGTFSGADIVLLNISISGMQISHPQPLRIGTRARLWFKQGELTVAVQAQVVWSHLARGKGGMAYQSGVRIDNADPQYAAAVNTMLRAGVVRQDLGTLDRKRQRLAERELQRKSQIRVMVPTSEPPPS